MPFLDDMWHMLLCPPYMQPQLKSRFCLQTPLGTSGSSALRLFSYTMSEATVPVTVGYMALTEAEFNEARWCDEFDDPSPRQWLLSNTPLKAIAATRKHHVRQLGVTLSHGTPPGPKTLLKRHESDSNVFPVMCEPNYMVLCVQTKKNMAALVAEGKLIVCKDGGFTLQRSFDPFQMDFEEGWTAEWLFLS